jgi:hypothetical protein
MILCYISQKFKSIYCIDDPKFPFKGVRGKGTVKIHEDVKVQLISVLQKKNNQNPNV